MYAITATNTFTDAPNTAASTMAVCNPTSTLTTPPIATTATIMTISK